jgi:hypothetical protein
VSEPDYPQNISSSKEQVIEINSGKLVVIDELDNEIADDNGWFRVPAGQTIRIQKYIKLEGEVIYADPEVNTLDDIVDYNVHRLDQAYQWTIDNNLSIDYMHDNRVSLLPDSAIRQTTQDIPISVYTVGVVTGN